MKIRGVHYDVGTACVPGELSRSLWNPGDALRDLRVIREELHATHVNVYGSELTFFTVADRFART